MLITLEPTFALQLQPYIIDRGHLYNYFGTKHDAFSHFEDQLQRKLH